MTNQQLKSGNPRVDIEYRRKKSAEEMREQIISFTLMIFFTLIAFGAVAYGKFSGWFTIPFLILLAVVQVLFQLYYFMHMKEKGHESPTIFLYSGVLVASMTVLALMTVVWW
ncbi:cytochrome c oxidase subunit IVB [Bacillus methanolicus]|uniref:cytochrome c oxidase subunit IVB n=1 Tax=Bacillus methanolicus TaxID=1471 RepID=UPI00200C5E18|nr:cytochrome c oxidase subunit IVB [Bacillus methanolicus]UQD51582.1 cytochrome c oxidase subunit IVB [Bacillus methanolicus]